MITSALISQARREYRDVPKKVRVTRKGDGSTNLFNVGFFPVIESSEAVNISGGATLSGGGVGYTLDNDSGDLTMATTPASGHELKSEHKYAHWRDTNWLEVIGQAVDTLNARGWFRQVVNSGIVISAGTMQITAPVGCVDVYSLKKKQTSAHLASFPFNWSYQQDANRIIFGAAPGGKISASFSYLRQMLRPSATSVTLDVPSAAIEPVKKYAGAMFFRSLAAKIAQQGNATIDEGHLSFTNMRTMANDLLAEYDNFAARSKPSRPARGVQWHIPGAGDAS